MPATFEQSPTDIKLTFSGALNQNDLDVLPSQLEGEINSLEIDWSEVTQVEDFFLAALAYALGSQVPEAEHRVKHSIPVVSLPGTNTELSQAFQTLYQGEEVVALPTEYLRLSPRWRTRAAQIRKVFTAKADELYPTAKMQVEEQELGQFFPEGQVPERFRVDIFSNADVRRYVTESLKFLVQYLDLPIINDTLDNDQDESTDGKARRAMRETLSDIDMSQQGGHATNMEFFLAFRNKRKLNAIGNLYSNADLVHLLVNEYMVENGLENQPALTELSERLQAAHDAIPLESLEYRILPLDRRLELVPIMNDRVADFLRATHDVLEVLASLRHGV